MRIRILSFITWIVLTLISPIVHAQNANTYYVHFSDGRIWGYPKELVKELLTVGNGYRLILENDSIISWSANEIVSIDEDQPEYPQFTRFKLDDKLNDQLFRDVEATVSPEGVTASVSGIGKYLTPLFTLDQENAIAYANGQEQVSGQSRLRFDNEVTYTLGNANYKQLSVEKVSDEIWSQPEAVVQELMLIEEMLSTNAPTSFSNEGLSMMLDDNPSTIFHSTWSQDPVYEVDPNINVHVAVALSYPISKMKFYYMGRPQANYNIEEWVIEASNDGVNWTYITTIDESMGLPTSGASVSYTSDAIDLDGWYNHIRFVATRTQYKNYLCLSELRIYEVIGESGDPELIQPAEYAYQMIPMGREVPVRIDWLTDQATSVPYIEINIDGGQMVTSKNYYLDAQIIFQGNGVWDDYNFQDSVKIKGRGNTSWSSSPYAKNPYRLKFAETKKPFGMKKGKNWNLIPQAQFGSLMTNPVAHKIARMVGMQTANDAIPVELYMNGEYWGSYYFTQKVGMANNSVDFDDESQAVLFELDTYYESGQFRSASYSLPVNIKAPDFDEDETQLDYYGIQDEFNRFETAVYNNTNYERFVDMGMLVRYMLINDLVLNAELNHPKSSFLSRENMNHMASQYTFGPGWDFDWAYGYENGHSYCISHSERDLFSFINSSGTDFFSGILRSSDWVQYQYHKLWEEFIDKHLDELIDFVDDYYAYARSSFENNSYRWGDGANYENNVANMKEWLRERANYIMNSLTPYDSEPFTFGDLNGDGIINNTDIEYMLSSLYGNPMYGQQDNQADIDFNGEISISDLTWLSLLINTQKEQQARSRRFISTLWGEDSEEDEEESYDFDVDDIPTLTPSQSNDTHVLNTRSISDTPSLTVSASSGKWDLAVSLTNTMPYIAYMMDFILPEGLTVSDGDAAISHTYRTESFTSTCRRISANTYRVIGYSHTNTATIGSEDVIFKLALNGTSALQPGRFSIRVDNVVCVTENASEVSLPSVATSFNITEDQTTQSTTPNIKSDNYWPTDVYDIHGRLVRKNAFSLNGLSKGVYVINNQKVVW